MPRRASGTESAWLLTRREPLLPEAALPELPPCLTDTALSGLVADQHGTQHLHQAYRLGVAQVHHANISGLAGRLIQTGNQALGQIHARRTGCTKHDRIDSGVGHHRNALPRVDRCAGRTARAGGIVEQPRHLHRHIRSQAVAHRHHLHLSRGRAVQGGNDAGNPLQVRGVVCDDQRVIVGIRHDGVIGRDQRAQYRYQVGRGFVIQPEDLRDDLVATRRRTTDPDWPGLQLGISLRHNAGHGTGLDNRKPLQPQGGLQQLVGLLRRDRLGRLKRDLAAHPRINDERLVEQMAERTDHRVDVSILEVERNGLTGFRFRCSPWRFALGDRLCRRRGRCRSRRRCGRCALARGAAR